MYMIRLCARCGIEFYIKNDMISDSEKIQKLKLELNSQKNDLKKRTNFVFKKDEQVKLYLVKLYLFKLYLVKYSELSKNLFKQKPMYNLLNKNLISLVLEKKCLKKS